MSLSSRFVEFVHIQHESLVQKYLGSNADMRAVVFPATALLIFLSLLFRLRWTSSSRMKLPPSPPGDWPINIGHLHLLGPAPHKSMAQLSQKYGPLMFLKLGAKPHVVVSSPEMAKEIFKRHDLIFSHRPSLAVSHRMDHMNHGFAFSENKA